MGDLLDWGAGWLDAQRHQHLTRPVLYTRGSATVEVLATIGKTVFETDNGYGILERSESRDFLIRAEDLVLDGVPVLPKRGDRVREAQDAKVYVYEVLAPGSVPEWRYSDPYRRTLRIHTKLIAMEA